MLNISDYFTSYLLSPPSYRINPLWLGPLESSSTFAPLIVVSGLCPRDPDELVSPMPFYLSHIQQYTNPQIQVRSLSI